VRLKYEVRALAGLIASLTFETSHSFLPKTSNSNSYVTNLRCAFLNMHRSSDLAVCFQRDLVPACRMAKVRTRSFRRLAFVKDTHLISHLVASSFLASVTP
jgi:hypothetical protein